MPATPNVDTLADNLVDNTLRKAITIVNASTDATNTITFNGCPNGTIRLATALPAINKNVDMQGPGRNNLTVRRDAVATFGIFTINTSVEATISGLSIENGNATNGGGIHHEGSQLNLVNAAVRNNTATQWGGGIWNWRGGVALENTLLTANSAPEGGGVYCGPGAFMAMPPSLYVEGGSSISGNNATLDGGGIYNAFGEVIIRGSSVISGNSAVRDGGGLYNRVNLLATVHSFLAVRESTVSGNFAGAMGQALARGGGIFNASLLEPVGLEIRDSVIDGNRAAEGADAGRGGGIYNRGRAEITATTGNRTTINGNRAETHGGGVYNESDIGTGLVVRLTVRQAEINANRILTVTTLGVGAGVFNGAYGPDVNHFGLEISHTTIARNLFNGSGVGGGLWNAVAARALLSNSTVSNNNAIGGGGIFVAPTGLVRTVNCQIVQNQAPGGGAGQGGGVFVDADATYTVVNTIIAGNSADASPDVFGVVNSLGHNLVGDSTGSSGFSSLLGDQIGTESSPIDPLLSELGYYGGPTETHVPLAGSPAIDAGDDAYAPLPDDQRGYARIAGIHVDIGSVEVQLVESGAAWYRSLRAIPVSRRLRR